MMNNIKIRRMWAIDIDEVVEVERQAFTTPWSRKAFEAEMYDNDLACYLVMISSGKIIGYAGAWLILDEAHVTNIALLPQYHHQGLGECLLNELIAYVRERGAASMTLEVRVSNLSAQKLYAKLGFVQKGIRRQYYTDSKEDALIMWRAPL